MWKCKVSGVGWVSGWWLRDICPQLNGTAGTSQSGETDRNTPLTAQLQVLVLHVHAERVAVVHRPGLARRGGLLLPRDRAHRALRGRCCCCRRRRWGRCGGSLRHGPRVSVHGCWGSSISSRRAFDLLRCCTRVTPAPARLAAGLSTRQVRHERHDSLRRERSTRAARSTEPLF